MMQNISVLYMNKLSLCHPTLMWYRVVVSFSPPLRGSHRRGSKCVRAVMCPKTGRFLSYEPPFGGTLAGEKNEVARDDPSLSRMLSSHSIHPVAPLSLSLQPDPFSQQLTSRCACHCL